MIGESVPKLILGTGGQIPRYLVPMLQTIVARRVDPFDTATVTIGSFDGTERYNAIKDQVTLVFLFFSFQHYFPCLSPGILIIIKSYTNDYLFSIYGV